MELDPDIFPREDEHVREKGYICAEGEMNIESMKIMTFANLEAYYEYLASLSDLPTDEDLIE